MTPEAFALPRPGGLHGGARAGCRGGELPPPPATGTTGNSLASGPETPGELAGARAPFALSPVDAVLPQASLRPMRSRPPMVCL